MRGTRHWIGITLGIVAFTGCDGDTDVAHERGPTVVAMRETATDPALVEQEMEAARQQIIARADSVKDALVSVRGLSRGERSELRRDVNARQVATARRMGVRAASESQIDRLVQQGRLVELEDSTEYWVVRELDFSVPYVTPDTRGMLVEIGRRFHARLDSLGLPRYRMEITSVLRTPETQADLRSRNGNAARGVSAHEFGTTVDVAHRLFAAPVPARMTTEIPSAPEQNAPIRYVEALVLEEVARKHAGALQAELGRVLAEMREEGKLQVMMERRQAVYHMTVARRY